MSLPAWRVKRTCHMTPLPSVTALVACLHTQTDTHTRTRTRWPAGEAGKCPGTHPHTQSLLRTDCSLPRPVYALNFRLPVSLAGCSPGCLILLPYCQAALGRKHDSVPGVNALGNSGLGYHSAGVCTWLAPPLLSFRPLARLSCLLCCETFAALPFAVPGRSRLSVALTLAAALSLSLSAPAAGHEARRAL